MKSRSGSRKGFRPRQSGVLMMRLVPADQQAIDDLVRYLTHGEVLVPPVTKTTAVRWALRQALRSIPAQQ